MLLGTFDHDYRDPEQAGSLNLCVSGEPSAVLRDDVVDRVVAQKLQFVFEVKRAALKDKFRVWRQGHLWRIDRADQKPCVVTCGEVIDFLAANGEKTRPGVWAT